MTGKLHSVRSPGLADRVATLETARTADIDWHKKVNDRLEKIDGSLAQLLTLWATAGRVKRAVDWIFRAIGYLATVGGAGLGAWKFFFGH